ncbi:hypothetical protein ACWCXB_34710 [Streptomyces sp. NPDC001514]
MPHSNLSKDALRQTMVEQLRLIMGLPDDECVACEADQVLPLDARPGVEPTAA